MSSTKRFLRRALPFAPVLAILPVFLMPAKLRQQSLPLAETASFQIPAGVRQGETIRIAALPAASLATGAVASFGKKQVRLFRQNDGSSIGLMPVTVDHAPGRHTLEILDASGSRVHAAQVEVSDAKFPRQNIRVSSGMKALKPLPGEIEAIRELQNLVSEQRFWSEPFLSPTADCMNSVFGVLRLHNGEFTGNFHRGVDLRSPRGRPVRAITAGVVKIAKMYRLHGGTVGIDHGQGVSSVYIHMSRIRAKVGGAVRAGDVIGDVGATGFATGPHLHWGLYVNGVPVNPAQWLPDVPRCR